MTRRLNLRSRLAKVAIAAVTFLLLGSVLPPLYKNQSRPLATDLNFTVTTSPSEGPALDMLKLLSHHKPDNSSGDPACTTEHAPMYCYIEQRSTTLQRVTTTAKTAKDAVASADSLLKISADGSTIAEVNESSLLNRESAYPIAGTNSSQQFTIAPLRTGVELKDGERDGISYFFPADAEERSYPYFDPIAQAAQPIDFTGTEKLEDIPVYTFHQEIAPLSIVDSLSSAQSASAAQEKEAQMLPSNLVLSGPAAGFYSAESLERYHLGAQDHVLLQPFYTVVRDVWVEPTTGTIVNIDEKISIFFATDATQAQQMIDADDTAARSLFTADLSWDDATRAERLSVVRPTITSIKVLSVVGWAGKALGVALLAYAAALFMRRHRAKATA